MEGRNGKEMTSWHAVYAVNPYSAIKKVQLSLSMRFLSPSGHI